MIHMIGKIIFGALGIVLLMFLPENNLETSLLLLSLSNIPDKFIHKITILVPLIIIIKWISFENYTIIILHSLVNLLFSYIYELFFLGGIRINNKNYMFSRKYYILEDSISELALVIFLVGLLFYLITVYNSFPVLKWKAKKLYKTNTSIKVCYYNRTLRCVEGSITDIGKNYMCISNSCFKDYQLISYKIIRRRSIYT